MTEKFKGVVYAERKGFEEAFWHDLDEAIEYIIDGYHPNYDQAKAIEVFECKLEFIEPNITADSIIEDVDNSADFQELPDGEYWSDNLTEAEKHELVAFLEAWLPKMKREIWRPTERKIDIDWDAEIKSYLAARAHYDQTPVTT